jgi:hypothetical protein
MRNAPSCKALLKKFSTCSSGLQAYFSHLPDLIQKYPLEIALAYIFLRTELAQNRTLYCGVVKLHHADSQITSSSLDAQHLTRGSFLDLYGKVFGEQLPTLTSDKLKAAEKIRDRVIHGKNVTAPQIREAIWAVLEYAEQINAHLQSKAGFQPFGDLRGFKGRGAPLDKSTSRWLLKGIGFAIK